MTVSTENGRECSRVWEAMPSVVMGTATREQDTWVHAHLAECDNCREEFNQQERLRHAMALPSDVHLDANAGLKRLLTRLDAPAEETVRVRTSSWLTRALVAAVLVQALGLGALALRLHGERPAYRTLSQVSAPVAAGAIHVVPDATMALADWNALLQAHHLQVVGGPNEAGAYTLVSTDPASSPDQLLRELRASRGIRFAEPVMRTP
ncbi:zf-HC2 domain-containing protein [Luteibacter sp. ME-Dv--P-043b]|jgi:hypothetical protein|uniref:zf-HC2 domain-containing protein n=1 Tax=unclassified Luteibacter TaxID=2620188 RepID=UPI002557A0C8|nr:zf-HC2 domain-containing protein [Luteibacter sp. ME-Dv--P-043b]